MIQSYKFSEEEVQGILNGSRAVLKNMPFEITARIIFDEVQNIIHFKAGYIALLSTDGKNNEVLFLEAGGGDCLVDPNLPMPIRGLRAKSYQTGEAVYHNEFMQSKYIKFLPKGHVKLQNVMFAPLVIDDKVVGIMGLANKPTPFTSRDAEIASYFGEFAALALKNSQILDKQEQMITQLKENSKLNQQIQELTKNNILIENVNEAIIGTDLQFNIQTWNKAAESIYGWTKNEVLGKFLGDLVEPEYIDEKPEEVLHIIRTSGRWKGEVSHKTKFGSRILIEGSVSVIRNEKKEQIGAVSINRDITRSKMMEENLKKSEKLNAIGQLAAGIAHDFNNILSGIMGYTELTLLELDKQSELTNNLDQILIGCHRARELIRQIQEFGRKDHDKMTIQLLYPIIMEVISFLKASIPKSVEIKQKIIPDIHPILVNTTEIHQILINVITNAVHAMDYKGIIEINLYDNEIEENIMGYFGRIVPGIYSIIEISDNGKGMDDFTLSHLFEPYFTTKPKSNGIGLGLSVVYGIMHSYKGNIQIETEIQKGTTFRLFFPKSAKKIRNEIKNQGIVSGSEHILLIDDEKSVLETHSKLLHSLGYSTTSCISSIEAMDIYLKDPNKYKLIMMDKVMPEKDGIELAKEILNYNPQMPIILFSGIKVGINSEEISKIGIKKFLKKPITRIELSQAIREVLDV